MKQVLPSRRLCACKGGPSTYITTGYEPLLREGAQGEIIKLCTACAGDVRPRIRQPVWLEKQEAK